jgi:hypothetical protein
MINKYLTVRWSAGRIAARSKGDPSLASLRPLRRTGCGAKNLVRGAAAYGRAATLLADQDSGGPGSSPSGGCAGSPREEKPPDSSGGLSRGGRRPLGRKPKPRGASSTARRPCAGRVVRRISGGSKAWKPGRERAELWLRSPRANGRQARSPARASRSPEGKSSEGMPYERCRLRSTRLRKKRRGKGGSPSMPRPAPGRGKPGVSGLSRPHALEGKKPHGRASAFGRTAPCRWALKTAQAYERQPRPARPDSRQAALGKTPKPGEGQRGSAEPIARYRGRSGL